MSALAAPRPRRVHVWAPECSAPGGIQRYSRFLVKALREILPSAAIEVFSLHDKEACFAGIRSFCAGRSPKSLRVAAFSIGVTLAALFRRPDIVILTHAHFAPLAEMVLKRLRIPYWVCAHGYEVWNPKNERVKHAIFQAERILAVSEFTKERLAEMAPSRERQVIRLLPNTFDEGMFTPGQKSEELLARLGLERESKIILTVARLDASERYKGYDRIIHSLAEIQSKIPFIHYVLVGEGDDRLRVERLIEEYHVAQLVTLAGRVSDDELCSYYNLCDVFAMPSTGEGFGIVFLEALACGKPVVAGNKDGSVTALAGGALGRLVDPEDSASLAHAIVESLEESNRVSSRCPATLRRAVIEQFGFDSFCARMREAFSE